MGTSPTGYLGGFRLPKVNIDILFHLYQQVNIFLSPLIFPIMPKKLKVVPTVPVLTSHLPTSTCPYYLLTGVWDDNNYENRNIEDKNIVMW